MKKNIMLRLSAVLLVAVLLTTCVISGTWAKYVTTGSADDKATVAKWGVTITAEAYADDNLEADLETTEDEIVASASVGSELLAPGTGIKFASINVAGTPDVAVKVEYSATLKLNGWRLSNNAQYVPIVFVITTTDAHGDPVKTELKADTMGELKELVQNTIAGYSKTYEAGTNLSGKAADELTVSCYWAYEGNDDVKDTELGDAGTATIELTIACTVTQID